MEVQWSLQYLVDETTFYLDSIFLSEKYEFVLLDVILFSNITMCFHIGYLLNCLLFAAILLLRTMIICKRKLVIIQTIQAALSQFKEV